MKKNKKKKMHGTPANVWTEDFVTKDKTMS